MNVNMRSPLICTRQHAVSTSFLALSQRSKPEFFTVRFFWSMAGPMALTITTGLHSCRLFASQPHTPTRGVNGQVSTLYAPLGSVFQATL